MVKGVAKIIKGLQALTADEDGGALIICWRNKEHTITAIEGTVPDVVDSVGRLLEEVKEQMTQKGWLDEDNDSED